jgi:hypothetical protein
VKVRLGLMAMVSVAAIGASLATGASPALANQTDMFSVFNGKLAYYMTTNNVPNKPLFVLTSPCECGTSFSNINGTTKSINGPNEPVYEWRQTRTNRCWTYMSNDHGYLETQPCIAGNTSQLFWQTLGHQFINVWASNIHGIDYCINASHATGVGGTSDFINVIACKSRTAPGGFDQYWSPF